MTTQNDFLPFAGAAGANVITQAVYAALAAQQTGFQSGVANSAQLNKVWRQASIMAAVLGQFIADNSGQSAVDDGTTATLEANLKKAINAAGITAPQFDNSTNLSTTAFVRQFGSSFAGVVALAGNNSIPASNAGQLMVVGGGGSSTQTLPAASSVAPGSRFGFKALPSSVTIARSGSDTITVNGGSTVTSITLNGGDTLSLVSDGVSNWQTYDGSAQLPFAAVMSGANWQSPAQFDNSARLMTSAAVRAVGLQFGNEVVLSGSTALDTSHAGKVVVLNHAGVASTYTLPSSATYPPGATITLFSVASAIGTIQRAGSDTISVNNGAPVTSLILGGGDSLMLMAEPGGWKPYGGTAQLGYAAAFGALFGSNGYQKLPSGLIIQWGSVTTATSADSPVTFPIAFPTSVRAVSLAANSSSAAIPVYNSLTSVGMNVGCWSTSGSRIAQTVPYIILGN
ncbi:gp53-like domain-containing protein [Ralstonia sp. UBA689]|uniref:gp53-like domain-containing protein n=1 Tax=Ralstonia sp. UBA689 TaxID=1947373 RepID=UPI0025F4EFD4|nr:hypothetical protein [Ralstonia sp. UBA689]